MSKTLVERLKAGMVEHNADSQDWLITKTMAAGAAEIERLVAIVEKREQTVSDLVYSLKELLRITDRIDSRWETMKSGPCVGSVYRDRARQRIEAALAAQSKDKEGEDA